MYRICPKCSHVRQDTETADPGVCPACGLIFARYAEAAERNASRRATVAPAPRKQGPARAVAIALLLVALTGALYWYRAHRHPHGATFETVVLPVAGFAGRTEQREFTELFDKGTPFAALAGDGHYTVIEVYLDECAYCRELEAALGTFQVKRQDVALVRVHHPGLMNTSVHGSSREDMQRQIDELNTKMKSYSLCGSPHVEVFGPDRKPLAVDGCGERPGTALLWNWIGSETGITRGSASGMVTRM